MSESPAMPIAIVGYSARLPGVDDMEGFWEMLRDSKIVVSDVSPDRWEAAAFYDEVQGVAGKTYSVRGGFLNGAYEFDEAFFGIGVEEAQKLDPQQRLALQEAWRTFEHAGYAPDRLNGTKIGVFVGARTGDYHDAILGNPEELDPATLMGHDTSILSARISHFLDLKGPNLTVNTACSSMGVALHQAVQSLQAGEVDMALVGGAHVMSTAQRFIMHSRGRLLSKSGNCRPFDEDADGIVLGEAVGFVLLKRRTEALASGDWIHANILATGVNHCGRTEKGIAAPSPQAQADLIREVLAKAAVSPKSISYIETHGTGTYKGDAIEVNALREAYGSEQAPGGTVIGSVKANVGHSLTAAVLPGLLKLLLCLQHRKLAAQANFGRANELINLTAGPFRIETNTSDWPGSADHPRRAALSAFSYTGTNFHLILEEEPEPVGQAQAPSAPMPCLIVLSARTADSLRAQAGQLGAWLARHRAEVDLRDVSFTLATGRAQLEFRKAFVANDLDDCMAQLQRIAGEVTLCERVVEEDVPSVAESSGRKTLFDLASLYEQGSLLDWSAQFNNSARRRPMPGYVFEKREARLNLGARVEADLRLVLCRRDEVCQNLLAHDFGGSTVAVKMGDGGWRRLGENIFQIDPREEEDYRRLIASLPSLTGKRVHVIHLWNYECEPLDFEYHGSLDRCLHLFQRSLDTGVRSLLLLQRALMRAQEIASLRVDFLYRGLQPQNAMAAGWVAEEWSRMPGVSFRSLRLPPEKIVPEELVKAITDRMGPHATGGVREFQCESSSSLWPRPLLPPDSDAGRFRLRERGAYLIDVGNLSNGWGFVEAWARTGVGRMVLLVDPAQQDEVQSRVSPEALCIPTKMAGEEDLKKLSGFLNQAGISEIRGVVCMTAGRDGEGFDANAVRMLALDDFSKESPLDFFLIVRVDEAARQAVGTRFADSMIELRRELVRAGRRRGASGLRRWLVPPGHSSDTASERDFQILFETASVSDPGKVVSALSSRRADALKPKFRGIMADVLRVDARRLDLSRSIDSMDLNSMQVVDVIDRINRAFETELRPSVFYKHKTLDGVFEEWLSLFPPDDDAGVERKGAEARPAVRTKPARLSIDRTANEPIAIVGMSGRFPKAQNLREFWRNLCEGVDCISEIPASRWNWQSSRSSADPERRNAAKWGGFIDDIDAFDPGFFGLSAREAELMDPQQRIFLQCVWEAIEDAGHDPTSFGGSTTGIFVGVSTSDYAKIVEEAGQEGQAHSPIGLFHSMLANRVSYFLDLRGPSQPIDTACSSSLVAVHRAIQSIRSGHCSQAIVGGVNALLTPSLFDAFAQAGMLSVDGRCQTFDERANGYVRGEGVGAMLLKPLSRAQAEGDPIYALIRGSAENHGGHASSLTAPSSQAQAEVLMRTYGQAGISPQTIGYIETHGTGTALGDPIEVDGLKHAFESLAADSPVKGGAAFCGLGSVKTNIGHLEAAAGIAGLIKSVLAIQHQMIPGSLHFRRVSPRLALEGSPFYVADKTRKWEVTPNEKGEREPRRAGVSSFGFGGVNAHVLIEECADVAKRALDSKHADLPIILSARTETSLRESAERLLRYLESRGTDPATGAENLTLRELVYTLQVGRAALPERMAFVARSLDDAQGILKAHLEGRDAVQVLRGTAGGGDATLDLFAKDDALREAVRTWTRTENWGRLLELWVKGLVVDWKEAYASGTPARVHLPTYPFARERYWAKPVRVSDEKAAKHRSPDRRECFLRKGWKSLATAPRKAVGGAVLVLANSGTMDFAKQLLARFADGEMLDISAPSAVLSRALTEYAGIIDVVGCGQGKDDGLEGLAWVQEMVAQAGEWRPKLVGVTRGLEAFENPAVNLAGALRAGLYRMLRSEYASVRALHVDVDPRDNQASVFEQITSELGSEGDAVQVCYRGGRRFVASLEEWPIAELAENGRRFPEGHVLWITGGTRGLGALCAGHFVQHFGVRKLVLSGRESLPPREEWSTREDKGDAVGEKIRLVRALESRGVEVRVMCPDLTDREAVRRCVEEIKGAMGPIGGVIHGAGVLGGESPAFIRKSSSEMRQVRNPKVTGTDVLFECLSGEPLAFMVLFSSVSAAVPRLAAGLSDYAMANGYLDHVAESGGRPFPIFSIQWPSWRETGMGAVDGGIYAQLGFLSLSNQEGLRFLDRILATGQGGAVMPVLCDTSLWSAESLLRAGETRLEPALRKGSICSSNPQPQDLAQATLQTATRDWLLDIFVSELKASPAQLKADARFQDYGMDSILLAQVVRRINRELGLRLDPSAVFEYPTVDGLANWLVRVHTDSLRLVETLDPVVATPDRPALVTAQERPEGNPTPAVKKDDAIAVVGMSCRFPGAESLDDYWSLLSEGRTAIARVPEQRWANPEGFVAGLLVSIGEFDSDYFLIQEDDARAMDPQALLVLEESLYLFHHAGYTPADVKGSRTGVYIGGRALGPAEPAYLIKARNPILAIGQNYLAANVSRFFDLHGPSLVVDTACSSALTGMHLAIQALRSGEIDCALVGGVSLLANDETHRLFQQRQLLSAGSQFHVFDQRASGVVLGEGIGMVLLKSMTKAEADGDRIYAVVRGMAINNDGRTAGPAAPNIHAQKAVMKMALDRSGRRPEEVGYIEANGSGSEVTDLLELKAINEIYGTCGRIRCQLGSGKPNIGHPLCAEGIAGFIKLVLMLDRRQQPPFLSGKCALTHFDVASSAFAFRKEVGPWEALRCAAQNCFADGGTNAHVILEGWDRSAASGPAQRGPIEPPPLNRRNLRSSGRNPWPSMLTPEYPFLKDHEAHGEKLLPGLAYLDVVHQHFREKGHSLEDLELRNLVIHHPLTARSDRDLRLETSTEETRQGVWSVHVGDSGRPGQEKSAYRKCYVTAEVRRCQTVAFAEKLDPDELRSVGSGVPLEEAYVHFRAKGLVHSGTMKAEGTVYSGKDARIIEVSLPTMAEFDASDFLFHPTLIDGAAVGAGTLFSDLVQGEERLFLPLCFGAFRAASRIGRRCYVRVRKSSVRRKNELLYSDLEFFDETGAKIAELTDFAYKLVRRSTLITDGEAEVASLVPQKEATTSASRRGQAEPSSSGAANVLRALIAAKLRRIASEIDLRLGYYEMGLESAMLLDLMLALEKKLSLSLSPTLLFEFATPAELAAHLEETYPEACGNFDMAGDDDGKQSRTRYLERAFRLEDAHSRSDCGRESGEAVLAALLENGLALWVEDGHLKVRALAERLTPEILETLDANCGKLADVLGVQRWLPLSRSQRRYWVMSALQPERSAYNNPIGLRLRGPVDIDRVREAFRLLINRHHVLRSTCPRTGKRPVMVIAPPISEAPGDVIRLSGPVDERKELALSELASAESRKPIHPAAGPNLRIQIIPMASDDVAIFLTAHHTVFDGYSYLPVLKDWMRLYRGLERNERLDGDLPAQYEDYVLREKSSGATKSQEFWKEHLQGAPSSVALPLDRERAAVNAGRGDTQSLRVDERAYRVARELIGEQRVTLFAFMLSVLKIAISQWSGQRDLVFGTTVQCRDEDGEEQVIGDFTNFIPIRTCLDGTEDFADLLQKVYQASLHCLHHKRFPFDEIVPLMTPVPPNINPVYNILVNQLPSITGMEEQLSDERLQVSVHNNRLLNGSAMLDLRFEWYEEKGGLRLICEYNTDLFRQDTIQMLLGRIGSCLDSGDYARGAKVRELMPLAARPATGKKTGVGSRKAEVQRNGSGAPEEEELLIHLIRGVKPVVDIGSRKDVSFFELGLGSFDVANLSAELENLYPEFVVADIFKHPTIHSLASYLRQSLLSAGPVLTTTGEARAGAINFELFRT